MLDKRTLRSFFFHKKDSASKKSQENHAHVLILRDYLAVDRTKLANDRAFLAHIGTGLTVLTAGVSGFNLFSNLLMRSISMMLVCTGVTIVIVGAVRYQRMQKKLDNLQVPDYEELIIDMENKKTSNKQ
jgi:putative membrane protein